MVFRHPPLHLFLIFLPDKEPNERSVGNVKIRINEVSIRHQGQFFQVLVLPDTAAVMRCALHSLSRSSRAAQDPSLFDIAPAASTPVEVKSKRNAVGQKKQSASVPAEQLPSAPSKRAKPLLEQGGHLHLHRWLLRLKTLLPYLHQGLRCPRRYLRWINSNSKWASRE